MGSIRRSLWAILAAGHGAAMPSLVLSFSSGDYGSNIVRLVSLSGAVLFCLLKAMDVRWLRIRPGWRPAVGSFIVAALLHANVLARQVGVESNQTPIPLGAAMLSTLLLEPNGLRQAVRTLRGWAGVRAVLSTVPRPVHAFFGWSAIDWHNLRSPVCGIVCQAPRPPPSP